MTTVVKNGGASHLTIVARTTNAPQALTFEEKSSSAEQIPIFSKESIDTHTDNPEKTGQTTMTDHRHTPEIVLTARAPASRVPGSANGVRSGGLFPSSGAVMAVIALCALSFLFGCTLTDSALCQTVIAMTGASGGFLPSGDVQDSRHDTEEDITFYEKYRDISQDASIGSQDTLYLGAANGVPSSSLPEDSDPPASQDTAPLAVQNDVGGKIGSDGTVLLPVMSRSIAAESLYTLSNETDFSPDLMALASKTPAALEDLVIANDQPLVLIVHTHGTESYNARSDGYYDKNAVTRSEDISQNVVSIGAALAETLCDFGIPTIHSEKMCDKDSFLRAYATSAAEVKAYLEKYPSIRFVIDLHRDSIASPDGTKTKPVFSHAGSDAAQLMFVVGTNGAGADHPHWKENLSLALTLQKSIGENVPDLFRPINLRLASFNEQLSPGYLLLECGSCANTHDEALHSIRLFGTELARVLLST